MNKTTYLFFIFHLFLLEVSYSFNKCFGVFLVPAQDLLEFSLLVVGFTFLKVLAGNFFLIIRNFAEQTLIFKIDLFVLLLKSLNSIHSTS